MSLTNPIDSINTLDDAKTFLRNANSSGTVLTESQLQQIIGRMNGTVAGSEVTLLYSGDITIGTNPDGSSVKIQSWQAAEAIGKNSGGKVATMGQTDIGKLLADSNFQNAAEKNSSINRRNSR